MSTKTRQDKTRQDKNLRICWILGAPPGPEFAILGGCGVVRVGVGAGGWPGPAGGRTPLIVCGLNAEQPLIVIVNPVFTQLLMTVSSAEDEDDSHTVCPHGESCHAAVGPPHHIFWGPSLTGLPDEEGDGVVEDPLLDGESQEDGLSHASFDHPDDEEEDLDSSFSRQLQ